MSFEFTSSAVYGCARKKRKKKKYKPVVGGGRGQVAGELFPFNQKVTQSIGTK